MTISRRSAESGSTLLTAISVVVVLSALAAAFLAVAVYDNADERAAEEGLRAFYIAEAGLSDALARIRFGNFDPIGTESGPVGFGGGSYWVQVAMTADSTWSVVSSAKFGGVRRAVQATIGNDGDSFFEGAVFGDGEVKLDSSVSTDSYDSSQGTYLSQAVNETAGVTHAGSEGRVDSNGAIGLDSGPRVFGDLVPGVGSIALMLGDTFVSGSTTPRSTPKAKPPITIPAAILNLPEIDVKGRGSDVLDYGPGAYYFKRIDLKGTSRIELTGPSTIVTKKVTLAHDATFKVDATNGPVFIYVEKEFKLEDRASVSSRVARAGDIFFLLVLNNADSDPKKRDKKLELKDDSEVHGVMYAPNGEVKLKDFSEFFGAVYANKVTLSDNARVHFDETLRRITSLPSGNALPWRSGERGIPVGSESGGGGAMDVGVLAWQEVAYGALPTN